MDEADARRLFDLADVVHGISRQLPPPSNLEPGICTPVEIHVMRCISKHPGKAARAISQASRLPSSNFSRAVRGLEAKGLVRRETNEADARSVDLHLTDMAARNFVRMRDAWSAALDGIVDDPSAMDEIIETLRRIEKALVERRQESGHQQD
ncbi:MarR family winged helix-turn-helix transcriptional regulator [Consotaella salsifontis]|uniref:DNA-binding transcriptional regulator, MarR family n=1 Tax=Consotaella salsifontis TaxID=1365950 RepID=A0A1T4SM65_9HYPH|nr:MarR family winged helix-turn-helix transcriptional regulator [Consotaella salsifontis]SKA29322.1 DNA-binding transcriptional regulator, MarR family [Consotaella salsifontis]